MPYVLMVLNATKQCVVLGKRSRVGEEKRREKKELATLLSSISIIFLGITGGGNNVNLEQLIYILQRGDNFI